MIPSPLHPAVVHFPIVFAMLLPLVAVAGLVAIRRGGAVLQWWGLTVLLMLGLAVSSFAAVRTGEAEEDRVESVVTEQPLHTHEEAAERFLVLTGVLLALGAAGLLRGRAGGALRVAGAVATIGIFAAGWQVGHTGGQLVYSHGAASAYAAPDGGTGGEDNVGAASENADRRSPQRNEGDEHDERDQRAERRDRRVRGRVVSGAPVAD